MAEFDGLRVLVVEDEGAVAIMIETMLEELGCEIAASVGRLSRAFEAADKAVFDLAVLDINVAGELVFPLARLLASRGKAFVFSTGYGASTIPDDLHGRPTVTKPYSTAELRRTISAALAKSRSPS